MVKTICLNQVFVLHSAENSYYTSWVILPAKHCKSQTILVAVTVVGSTSNPHTSNEWEWGTKIYHNTPSLLFSHDGVKASFDE